MKMIRVGEEEGGGGGFTMIQRPGISPFKECGGEIDAEESGRDIRNDPKYKPNRSPWLSQKHSHILASQPQRRHPNPINHPKHQKSSLTIRIRIPTGFGGRCRGASKRDLKGERNQGIRKGEEEISCHSGDPAPDNELVEM